jgi:hypothetical protein
MIKIWALAQLAVAKAIVSILQSILQINLTAKDNLGTENGCSFK